MKKATRKKETIENNLKKLEGIVKKMEAGKLPLEEGLKLFTEGIQLTQACYQTLSETKQKVDILLQENESFITEPFELDTEFENEDDDDDDDPE